jgi:hypothetical protein
LIRAIEGVGANEISTTECSIFFECRVR